MNKRGHKELKEQIPIKKYKNKTMTTKYKQKRRVERRQRAWSVGSPWPMPFRATPTFRRHPRSVQIFARPLLHLEIKNHLYLSARANAEAVGNAAPPLRSSSTCRRSRLASLTRSPAGI